MQDDEPESLDEYHVPGFTVGTVTTIQEYSKPRKKIRRRPIGFLRDDWPDIVE
jgi:hypothetical protein